MKVDGNQTKVTFVAEIYFSIQHFNNGFGYHPQQANKKLWISRNKIEKSFGNQYENDLLSGWKFQLDLNQRATHQMTWWSKDLKKKSSLSHGK